MKSIYIVNVQGFKSQNPNSEYLELLIETFRAMYTKPNDEIHVVDHSTAYGSIMKMASQNHDVREVIVAPLNLTDRTAIDNMRAQSIAKSQALVADIIPPGQDIEFYSINPDLFYINLDLIDRRESLDWGTYLEAGIDKDLYLNYPVIDNGSYIRLNTRRVTDPLILDNGWILLNKLLGLGLRVGQRNESLVVDTTNYWPDLIKIVIDDKSSVNKDLYCDYFSIVKQVITTRWETELFTKSNAIQISGFVNNNIFVENCYMIADLKFSGLQQLYKLNRDDDTRLIFVHTTSGNQTLVKHVLENWNGTNVVTDDINVQSDLDQFYQSFPSGEFDKFWNYCKSLYCVHYECTLDELVADLESQCHVNNIFWIGHESKNPVILKASRLRLAATEFYYLQPNETVGITKLGARYYIKNLYKKFRLTFRNTQTNAQQSIAWNLKDNLLTQKWARCNQFDYLEEECIAEKNYMLQHWEYDNDNPNARSVSALCNEMNRYVAIINNYFNGSSDVRVNYHITQYFDPVTLDQNILNEIHHHFEVLIGQVWNVSDYFKKADLPTSFAIRQLNNLCHEMESLRRPKVSDGQSYWNVYIYFPFIPGRRYKFVESDFDHFTRTREYGDLLLHYAQLGKTPLEAWQGSDEVIFDENITGLRYLSGEFVISFGPDVPKELQLSSIEKLDQKFFPWLESRGQDPRSKFTGVGTICIGSFDRTLFPGKTAEEIMLELFKYDDVYRLELLDQFDNILSTKTLDYDWKYVLSQTDPTRIQNL
jgi:hypothetical protein